MNRRAVSGITLTLLSIGMLALAFNVHPIESDPKTIYVNDDNISGPWDGTPEHPYQNITSGLEHAVEGDTIFVYSGTYNEKVTLDETLTLLGENRETTIINGSGLLPPLQVIYVTADYVNITDFTIVDGWGPMGSGILLNSSSFSTISGNNITNNKSGISLHNSSGNTVSGNNITNNEVGISIDNSTYNGISGNNITANYENGIWLWACSNNTISGNHIESNLQYGIRLYESPNNTLRNNDASNNKYNFGVLGSLLSYIQDIDDSNTVNGKPVYYWVNRQDMAVPLDAGYVGLVNCTRITVKNLNLTNNWQGVLLALTTNSTITKNIIANNEDGICLSSSSNYNSISGNNITDNNEYGIWFRDSSDNSIYHNDFVNNVAQVYTENSVNKWDDGYPSGGNYWGDYTDVDIYRGPGQNQPGSDRIWDHPYVIDADNQDRYPLVHPWPTHDIAILSITWSDLHPATDETMHIYVTVENQGNIAETFDVNVNYTLCGLDPLIGTQTITLEPTVKTTLDFMWTPTVQGLYRIEAYTSTIPNDINLSDNTRHRYLFVW